MNRPVSDKCDFSRDSNIELARVVSMSAIIIHHFLCHGMRLWENSSEFYRVINSFLYFGVDVFFLISGYFGIRLSLARIVRFVVLIAFFDIVNLLMTYAAGGSVGEFQLIMLALTPVSSSYYWFIQVYFVLMIVTPFLNRSLTDMSLPVMRKAVLLLSLVVWYSCTFGKNISGYGGSFVLGLYLYILGAYIRRDYALFSRLSGCRWFLVAFVILALLSVSNAMAAIAGAKMSFSSYTGPFMVLASCAIMLGCSRLSFRSAFVNRLGFASLGCYLLQDGLFGYKVLYPWQYGLWNGCGSMTIVVVQFIAVFILFWLVSYPLSLCARRLGNFAVGLIPEKIISRFRFS